jgi:hypothetical protein
MTDTRIAANNTAESSPGAHQPGQEITREPDSPWRDAGPELLIAAIAVAAVAIAGLATAGWAGLATVAIGTAALSMLVLRGLAPGTAGQLIRKAKEKPAARTIGGYAQRRFVVGTSVSSMAFYQSDLRPALEHLLAARLAEVHGINLYTDPASARRAFCKTRADEALWPWIDPEQAETTQVRGRTASGIPRRTLTRLVDRLEHL